MVVNAPGRGVSLIPNQEAGAERAGVFIQECLRQEGGGPGGSLAQDGA